MGKTGVSQEQVYNAINELIINDRSTTVSNIREILKTGSLSTISKHLKNWKKCRKDIDPIPNGPTISNFMRMMTNIKQHKIESMVFEDYIKTPPPKAFMEIIKLEKINSCAIFSMDIDLCRGIIEYLLGGDCKKKVEISEITVIELKIIKQIILWIINDFNQAWNPIVNMQSQPIRSEINKEFTGIIPNHQNVIISKFTLEIENVSGDLTIVIPKEALFPLRDQLITFED